MYRDEKDSALEELEHSSSSLLPLSYSPLLTRGYLKFLLEVDKLLSHQFIQKVA